MDLRIRELRERKGWTQTDLALKAGLSRSLLSLIETGARHPNTRRLERIAKALGCDPADLLPPDPAADRVRRLAEQMRGLPPEDIEAIERLVGSLTQERRRGDGA